MRSFYQTIKVLALASVVAGGVLAAQSANATIVIDSFNVGNQFVAGTVAGNYSAAQVSGPTGEIIGGTRDLSLNIISDSGSGVLQSKGVVIATTPPGKMTINNDADMVSIVTLDWNANGAGLGGIDLTEGGNSNGFDLSILTIDLNLTATITVTDTANVTSTRVLTGLTAPSDAIFFYSDFTGGATNFASVKSIALSLSGPELTDGTFDYLQTHTVVPEPATMSLLAVGGGLLGFVRRRRRQA